MSRRRFLRGAAFLGMGAAAAWACGSSDDKSFFTTLERAIVLKDDGTLGPGPGEPYTVRTELAPAQAGREGRRRSLLVFHHLSDFRITDEESPLRSEWAESCPTPLSTSAFRPQESLSAQAAAALVKEANGIDRSPVTERAVDFAIHTGNAADNAQYNELRWFLDLMDGKPVHPDSGKDGYEGAQDGSPLSSLPDLLENAQQAFTPEPLAYPWYAVIGNRDVLAQGNFARSDDANKIAVGDRKITSLGPQAQAKVCVDPQTLLGPGSSATIIGDPRTEVRRVTPDAGRKLLTKPEWMQEHLATADQPGPNGHGFAAANVQHGSAYYVLDHGPVAIVVLDTVNPGGFETGNMDAAQFAWLEEQLTARSSSYVNKDGKTVRTENPDKLIIVASHHGSQAMTNPFPGADGKEERIRGAIVRQLLHRFPNVVMHISGHGLNRIAASADPGRAGRGYWEVATASPQEFPMQGRLLEIVDNGDGTISIFSTVYDSAAPISPGSAPQGADGSPGPEALAAAARQIAAGDPQRKQDAAGLGPSDRNVELIVAAPFDLSAVPTPPHRQGGGA